MSSLGKSSNKIEDDQQAMFDYQRVIGMFDGDNNGIIIIIVG